jgi:ribonuclease D
MKPLKYKRRLNKLEIKQLPAFEGVSLERIKVIKHESDIDEVATSILGADVVGFDTETKPNFIAGEIPNGISLVQVASHEGALLFKLTDNAVCEVVEQLIHTNSVLKVGFGLKQDKQQLFRRFGSELRNAKDLSTEFSRYGIKQKVGAQAAVAMALGMQLAKPKHIQLSNWDNDKLSRSQMVYAANDAYSAYEVYQALFSGEE